MKGSRGVGLERVGQGLRARAQGSAATPDVLQAIPDSPQGGR